MKRANENYLDLLGRVRPGVDPQALEAKLRVEFHELAGESCARTWSRAKSSYGSSRRSTCPPVEGALRRCGTNIEDGLKLLLIAAGCVLLVACGNLANLMLARGLKNRTQISVRVALGASRLRLVRRALVESVLLAVIGGALGIAVAYAGTRLILHLAFQIGGPNNFVPVSPDAVLAGAAVCPGYFDLHRDDLWNGSGMDDFACRSSGSAARSEPLSGRRPLVGSEVPGHRTGGDVAGAAVGSRIAGAEPAEPEEPGFRIRDAGPLYRMDQSNAEQLQAGADGAIVPKDR